MINSNTEENIQGVRFSPKETKNKRFCSVFGCSSKACKNLDVRFHQFPPPNKSFVKIVNKSGIEETVDRRKQWERVLKQGKEITPNMCVCSLHFRKEDYTLPSENPAGKRYLKLTAIPSCNLPKSSAYKSDESSELKQVLAKSRLQRRTNREILQDLNIVKIPECEEQVADSIHFSENTDEINGANDIVQSLTKDVGTQVKSGDFNETNFSSFLTTDKELSCATGIPNFEMLNMFIKIVERLAPRLSFYTAKLSVKDRIILTFMKLKQNMSYAYLNILFKTISERHIANVICNILDILGNALKFAIVFPQKEEIQRNIPHCFQDYADGRLIFDCTEIEIQKPQGLCCQLLTYSLYKGRFSLKFLTACTPGGLLAYVSPAYGGRTSDKAIFEQSGIIDLLDTTDKIMVDRGFLIDELCTQHGIKIVRPPFLRNKVQFSEAEALNSCNIASARVHIERLNQRLKVFEILGGKMPSCLVKKCENIMTVISAVVNLSAPILSDERFPK